MKQPFTEHAIPMVASTIGHSAFYPVDVRVKRAVENRNRVTTLFRLILAIPHLILVGGPIAGAMTLTWRSNGSNADASFGGGLLGVVVSVCAIIAWFAILFAGRYPDGLWNLVAFYLRWRVRATAYVALLRDDYPPFGDAAYPVSLELEPPTGERDKVSVAFRLILAIPHFLVVWALGIAWAFTTMFAWFAILFTGKYPETLYEFGVGVLRWSTRVEAYLLLLRDEYPPFSLD